MYYAVFYRQHGSGWSPADQRGHDGDYETYPVLWVSHRRAEEWANEFRHQAGPGCETRVVDVTITPPKD